MVTVTAPVSLERLAAKKSPISRTKRAEKKEIQDPELPPENEDSSSATAEVTKSRKRKAPPTIPSQRNAKKNPRQEPEKRELLFGHPLNFLHVYLLMNLLFFLNIKHL
jgi:hypothetical protein